MATQKAKVFLDYDQEELDRNYDQRPWAPNVEDVIGRWAEESNAIRARLALRANVLYGPTPDEVLDIFPASHAHAPTLVFIHGGAWQRLSKDESCFAAEAYVKAGANFIAVNFANIPKVRLPQMVEQVRRAVAWVYRNAGSFGGDREAIYVAGQSSGGHLAGMVLVTDWAALDGLPPNLVRGGICISGMYDLEPVMLSSRREYLRLTKAEEAEFSSQRELGQLRCPVVVAYGGKESPEFQRQARDFAAALDKRGRLFELVRCPEANHFEMGGLLADLASPLGKAATRLMGLAG